MKRPFAFATLILLLSVAPVLAADPPSYVELADAPTIAVDWSEGSTQAVTLHDNRALTFSNGQKGARYLLIITQDATGSRIVTWPASIRWPGGPPQTRGQPASVLTTTANRTDYVTLFYNGANYDVLGLASNY